jgi:Fe-S cluster biogenesis protein NfuA/nitrite reductase/ring-hydroxylating ferredoxin subunit
MTGVQAVSARVEELLDSLKAGGFGGAAPAAEELVSLLVGLYGDGLAQILAVLADQPGGLAMIDALADDPLIESLLLLHGLHPLDVNARIQRALDRVRPYLGSHAGGVEYLGVDAGGVARLRLEGSCHGCPSSTVTVELAITGAVQDAAPEVTNVVVEGMTAPPEPKLLQIGRKPDDIAVPPHPGNVAAWVQLPAIGPPSARPVTASADGVPVLLCSVRGTLYAYRDACAACGSAMGDGALDREILTCPACGVQYNVRLAGKGVSDAALYLDALPLLTDSQGIRVAVPEVASS